MSIGIQCSGCGKKLTAKDELAGKRVKCPACGLAVVIAADPPTAEANLGPKAPTNSAAEPRSASKSKAGTSDQETKAPSLVARMIRWLRIWRLSRRLRRAEDWRSIGADAKALREFGDPRAANALVECLQHNIYRRESSFSDVDPQLEAFVELFEALASFGPRARGARSYLESAALKDENQHLRLAAAKAVKRIAGPQGISEFASSAHNPKNKFQIRAVEALGACSGPEALQALLKCLSDEKKELRLAAAEQLTAYGESSVLAQAIQLLEPTLLKSSSGICRDTLVMLQRWGWEPRTAAQRIALAIDRGRLDEAAAEGSDGLAAVVAAALHDESRLNAAIDTFKNWHREEVAALFARALPHVFESSEAARALAAIGDFSAIGPLARELRMARFKYLAKGVRQALHDLRNRLGDGVLEPLVAALSTSNWDAIQDAVCGLKEYGWLPESAEHRAVFAVARGNVKQALAEGPAAATPLMLSLASAGSSDLGCEIAWALVDLGEVRAIPAVLQALGEPTSNYPRSVLAHLLNTHGAKLDKMDLTRLAQMSPVAKVEHRYFEERSNGEVDDVITTEEFDRSEVVRLAQQELARRTASDA